MWWRWYIHTTSAVPPPAGPQRRHGGSELPVEPVSPEDVSISRPSVGELRSFDSSLLRRFSLRLPETRWKSTGLRRCRRPCTRQRGLSWGPHASGPPHELWAQLCGHSRGRGGSGAAGAQDWERGIGGVWVAAGGQR
jgi:hypothetical protein